MEWIFYGHVQVEDANLGRLSTHFFIQQKINKGNE